jgi:actin-like ATPase involved in cell morphogenesis
LNPLSFFSPSTFYVRFDASSLSVLDTQTLDEFRDEPLVATRQGEDGIGRVVAIGYRAKLVRDRDVVVVNPFAHERLVIHEFEQAEALLRYAIARTTGKVRMVRPNMVIHPLRQLSSGLSDVERRALQEFAVTAGARAVVVHVGPHLSPEEAQRLVKT